MRVPTPCIPSIDISGVVEATGGRKTWWEFVLAGVLAIAFRVAAIVLPGRIMFGDILDEISGAAKPRSASMTAVAAFLALVALVAIDGLISLIGGTTTDKRHGKLRGELRSLNACLNPSIRSFRVREPSSLAARRPTRRSFLLCVTD